MSTTDGRLTKEQLAASSAIFWQGPSPYNGQPIMAVISGLRKPSDNDKTGHMAQVDILVADEHPVEAIKTGADAAICGGCPLRRNDEGRICYVNVGFGPSAKFRAQLAARYIHMEPETVGLILRERGITARFGSYGDPAMLPFEVVDAVIGTAGTGWTSYTHQWNEPWFDARHLQYAMASLDHINTVDKLRSLHPTARYYRLADSYEGIGSDEVRCPSDKTQRKADGRRQVTCETCLLCGGAGKAAKSVVIVEGS